MYSSFENIVEKYIVHEKTLRIYSESQKSYVVQNEFCRLCEPCKKPC